MPIERIFLGWDRPLVTAVTEHLCAGRTSRPLDLADTAVVVPTQQAGRRLREALASHAAALGTGLWSPRVTPPAGLLALPVRPPLATALEMEATWLDLLRRVRLHDFPALFPVAPAVQDTAWALPLARALRRLRSTLAEAGLLIRDVAEGAGSEVVEADRWADLARLEGFFLRDLARAGRADPVSAQLAAARDPQPAEGIRRILVAGVADLAPLYQQALTRLAESVAVQILIAAPAARAGDFDGWGCPRVEVWSREPLELDDDASALALCAGPAGQARQVVAWLEAEAARFDASHVAIGVPDAEVVAPLAAVLAERGQRAHDPGGRPVREHPVAQLLEAAAQLATEGDYAAFAAFARHADVLEALAAERRIQPAAALRQLDEFQNETLPASFAEMAQRLAGATAESAVADLARVAEFAQAFLADLAQRPAETVLRALLAAVYAHRSIQPGAPRGEAFIEVGRVIGDALAELGRLQVDGQPLPAADFLSLLLAQLREDRWYPDRVDGALDLEGWLELAWTDAPFVILTGANEGLLPEGQLADLFLPDALRGRLGLRDDANRAARDTFLLRALLASRGRDGRVAIALGRSTAAGDPLKPSRLLFRCPDERLPARCRLLFGEVQDPRPRPAVSVPFRLRPQQARGPLAIERLRVTDFRGYLACPFRFYLRRVLGMEEQDDRKLELDAPDFGNLVHHALQAMAASDVWKGATDAEALGDFLADEAANRARRQFGVHPPLQIEFQVESAQQRLCAAARQHVAAVQEGWELLAAEYAFAGEIGGLPIRGRMDRIERHRARGVLRVLDYKSSDQADAPAAAHLGPWREDLPDYARVEAADRPRAWRDLQLPLYRLLLREVPEFSGFAQVEVGYFNLPKAVGQTGIQVWEDFDASLLDAARCCAEGVVQDLRAGRFWPPRENVRYDDFAHLFPGPVADFVDPAGLASSDSPLGTRHSALL